MDDVMHLVKRDELDDKFNLPSVALCGLIFFPEMDVEKPKCPKCEERLESVVREFAPTN